MERDTWTCKFCGKLETNITEFAKHLLVHYKMKLKKECEICKSSFGSLGVSILIMHYTRSYNLMFLEIKEAFKNSTFLPIGSKSFQ